MRSGGLLAPLSLALVLSSGPLEARTYGPALIEGVPHVRQKPDFCGEACAEMALRKLGHEVEQGRVFDQAGLDPAEGRGCYTAELARALERIGFRVGQVWRRFPPAAAAAALEDEWRAIHADLLRGIPSIACMRYDRRPGAPEHFRLILGYDAGKDEVIYHEPAEEGGA